ncbi:hypothetical protein PoB_001072200 [Plakobranchus ocellatus]|uniref:Uncharacterized protein n=1 Tax=Plakobranchus ocellatus TaxID=259542 RepID=A0AAV3YQ11_9GAST|nr:hypothetical protein PoB_001072200 [Plakobranchus ocellatus]
MDSNCVLEDRGQWQHLDHKQSLLRQASTCPSLRTRRRTPDQTGAKKSSERELGHATQSTPLLPQLISNIFYRKKELWSSEDIPT